MKTNYYNIVSEDVKYIIGQQLPWEKLYSKTILITGANGFISSYIVYTLLELNDMYGMDVNVLALVRNEEKAKQKFANILNRNDFKIIVHDVCIPMELEIAVDIIIHAASPANMKEYTFNPVGTLNANMLGTANMLELLKNNPNSTILYISSGIVYGKVNTEKPINENDIGILDFTNFKNAYGEGKRVGEMLCAAYSQQYSIKTKIVRLFSIYGPGDDINAERVFTDFLKDIKAENNIRMKSDGSSIRSFCYISDAVLGIFTALLKGDYGTAYNIGSKTEVLSILELAKAFISVSKNKNIQILSNYDDKFKNMRKIPDYFVPDISRLESLGWTPNVGIESGILRTIQSLGKIE